MQNTYYFDLSFSGILTVLLQSSILFLGILSVMSAAAFFLHPVGYLISIGLTVFIGWVFGETILSSLCEVIVSTFFLLAFADRRKLVVAHDVVEYAGMFEFETKTVSSVEIKSLSSGRGGFQSFMFVAFKESSPDVQIKSNLACFFYFLELKKTQQNRINKKNS